LHQLHGNLCGTAFTTAHHFFSRGIKQLQPFLFNGFLGKVMTNINARHLCDKFIPELVDMHGNTAELWPLAAGYLNCTQNNFQKSLNGRMMMMMLPGADRSLQNSQHFVWHLQVRVNFGKKLKQKSSHQGIT
jgi:hypothetical protein